MQALLEGSTSITAPEEHLNELYATVLRKSIRPGYAAQEKEALYGMIQHILGSIVILFSLLFARSLKRLLNVTKQMTDQVLKGLHAILDIPKIDIYPLCLHHPSFQDYLLSIDRCKDPDFWVAEEQAYQTLASNCVQLMSVSLKQDICGLGVSDLATNIERSQIEQYLSSEL